MPGAGHIQENRREAVDRNQDAGKATLSSSIELGLDLLVVGDKDLARPGFRVLLPQVLVPWDNSPFTEGGDGISGPKAAIAIDNQARVRLPGRRRARPPAAARR